MLKTKHLPFQLDVKNMAYFVEIISIEITKTKVDHLWGWQKYLFAFMLRNAVPDIQFYRSLIIEPLPSAPILDYKFYQFYVEE